MFNQFNAMIRVQMRVIRFPIKRTLQHLRTSTGECLLSWRWQANRGRYGDGHVAII